MRKVILLLALLCNTFLISTAQKVKTLKKVIELQMPEGSGRNGAAVVYHPLLKKYYASFAGNASFPMGVFDLKGKRLSADTVTAGFDVRGLWYNPTKKTLQANGYNDNGWTNYKLDKKGIPVSNTVFIEDMTQPNEQCVAAFNDKMKEVYFLSNNKVVTYDLNGIEKSEKQLIFEEPELDEEENELLPANFNSTSLIYTGIPKAEWGLYDTESKEVVLFDRNSGEITQKWKINEDAPEIVVFCFSYTNGIVFLFDIESRVWYGYK